MSLLLGAMVDWVREVTDGWNRFWFTPIDPATLGLIRILAGAMLFYTHAVWGLQLDTFFGAHGWLASDTVHLLEPDAYGWSTWSYLWWCQTPMLLWSTHVVALVAFALLTLGLWTRAAAVASFIAAASYVGRARGALFGLDQINVMLAMYLMVGPAGDAYSLDRWRKARALGGPLPVTPKIGANIALRLIQVHMCIIYLFAGMAKLSGEAWWDGTAMWMALGNYEYQSLDMTWLAAWPLAINLLSHVTVFWELFYWLLIWPRLTRPVVLLLAIPLHLGIAICLGMMTFGLVMLIGNLAFVSPELVRAVLDRRRIAADQRLPAQSPATLALATAPRSKPAQSKRPSAGRS